MKFQIKSSWLVHLIIWLFVFELVVTAIDIHDTNIIIMWIFICVTILILLLFVFPFYFSSYYKLHDDGGYLQLKFGFLSEANIPYKSIRRLAPSKKIMISYAFHFERLELVYEGLDKNKYTVMVSPKDKEEFIKQLQIRNPYIDTNSTLSEQAAGARSDS